MVNMLLLATVDVTLQLALNSGNWLVVTEIMSCHTVCCRVTLCLHDTLLVIERCRDKLEIK